MLGGSQLRRTVFGAAVVLLAVAGCTRPRDYIHNGFKVGPNYCTPAAPVAEHWIDAADKRVREDAEVPVRWWALFKDPVLDRLVLDAYRQNLTLREACFRILEARAQLGIAVGNVFPQTQNATGSYRRIGQGRNFFDQWNTNFNLAWELDFWGRFRRAVASADDLLDASVADYDNVLVMLLGDVATNYVDLRGAQEQIKLLKENARIQREVVTFIDTRLKEGFRVTDLDLAQAQATLAQTEAQIPPLEITVRQANDRLCTLLGIPTVDLLERLGPGPIPTAPVEAAVGLPAELLRRRPDVRRAERLAAAQAEQIGIAESDFYPAFTISGTLGYSARSFPALFSPGAFNSNVGPSFQWNLLNYGRILNNVRLQDARFQELVAAYQESVLQANQEVEDGLVTFLQGQQRTKLLQESVSASQRALRVIIEQFKAGLVDLNRYAVIEQNLVTQQDQLAQAQAQIALGLIQVYRALGGGWQIRFLPEEASPPGFEMPPSPPPVPEVVPPAPILPAKPTPAEEALKPAPEPAAKAPAAEP